MNNGRYGLKTVQTPCRWSIGRSVVWHPGLVVVGVGFLNSKAAS